MEDLILRDDDAVLGAAVESLKSCGYAIGPRWNVSQLVAAVARCDGRSLDRAGLGDDRDARDSLSVGV